MWSILGVAFVVDEIIEIIRRSSLSDMPRRVAEVGEGR